MPPLSAAERRLFARIVAERVDELEAGVAEARDVEELELLVCLAAARFEGAEVPDGAVELLVEGLERRGAFAGGTGPCRFRALCGPDRGAAPSARGRARLRAAPARGLRGADARCRRRR